MRIYDKCLNSFIHDLKDAKRLSAEETSRLIALYQQTSDKKILDQIILGNIWFLISRAKRYSNRYLSSSDLIYSGILGITRAAKKYDPTKNIKFITYASYWVDMHMRRESIYNSSIVKVTPRVWEIASSIAKMKNSGMPDEEIISKLKIRKNTYRKLRKNHADLSLNSFITEEPDSEELENLILVNNETPAQICEEFDQSNYLAGALNKLKKREKEVIERRFGLSGFNQENIHEISRIEKVSAERVRQILKSGLRKLKSAFPRRDLHSK